MPLPGSARFAQVDAESGALQEFDSVGFVVAYHNERDALREGGEGSKRHFTLRVYPRELARLAWLSDYLDVPKSTLARQLLGAALVEGLDSLNLLEESKSQVEAEISAIELQLIGEVS